MNSQKLLEQLTINITILTENLRKHQLDDGGFKGYYTYDNISGIWTTCEIIHILLKTNPGLSTDEGISKAINYISSFQNTEGGWGFRGKGKPIVDITSWACLALSHFKAYKPQIIKGVEFILRARTNITNKDKGGWGLTAYEPDRIYSTWIASNCLRRLLTHHKDWFDVETTEKMQIAIKESHDWILQSKNTDNGWGPLDDDETCLTSSAISLISIFSQGEDPRKHTNTFELIKKNAQGHIWQAESEIVVTQEGYELTQEWFTSIYCFRAYIFFAELGICSIEDIHNTYLALVDLIEEGKVKMGKQDTSNIIWTIPLMIEGLDKFRLFVLNNKKHYDDFLARKAVEEKKRRMKQMEDNLKNHFPYPISQVYFSFTHEIDYHRKFQYLIQLFEVILKYTTITCLSSILAANEHNEKFRIALNGNIRLPYLGQWQSILEIILTHSEKVRTIFHPEDKEELLKKQFNYLDPESHKKLNLSETLSEFVTLRNKWSGHGAIRSVYEYKMEIEAKLPLIFSLLNRFLFLARCNSFLILSSDYNEFGDGDLYKIRVFNGLDILDNDLEIQKRLSEGEREKMIRYVYFHNTENNTIINLYPFLSYMFCPECKRERFFFYNGTNSNNENIYYLSFECGHAKESSNINHFKKRFASIDVQF